ncbi:hypothetical protein M413DRAFT_442336 [Hebeloma cylindrosporum]|uniref:Uncharacterized protein n=1 Tax=Hebeloma cylindrosporum TaxID=76867 RepID=A0A0C3CNQ4_HEBCY|nr:hypothetical protein M413DRAFT_442336 [Hebeloma cylindrosporum h7]
MSIPEFQISFSTPSLARQVVQVYKSCGKPRSRTLGFLRISSDIRVGSLLLSF